MKLIKKGKVVSVSGDGHTFDQKEIKKLSFEEFSKMFYGKIKTCMFLTYETISGKKVSAKSRKKYMDGFKKASTSSK